MVKLNTVESYKEYGKCVEITNGVISALVTTEIGPRIISFGLSGGQNFMNDDRKLLGGKDMDKPYTDFFGENRHWENLGGHRVWLSPESYPETYTPDDRPCKVVPTKSGAIFVYAEDSEIGVQKEMEIKMDADDTNMQVLMRVKNISEETKEFAVWALSVCSQNGTLIIPMNTVDTGLLPNRRTVLWPYTDPRSENYYWGKKYITVKQIPEGEQYAGKLGVDLNFGTAYYVKGEDILCKKYDTNHPAGNYPDGGCSFETYVCNAMIEFETLSELKKVAVGETVEHIEHWSICKKPCDVDFTNDESIDNMLNKL